MSSTASVLFYDVVPGDILPACDVGIAVVTLAILAALAQDLWGEWRKPMPIPVGETS